MVAILDLFRSLGRHASHRGTSPPPLHRRAGRRAGPAHRDRTARRHHRHHRAHRGHWDRRRLAGPAAGYQHAGALAEDLNDGRLPAEPIVDGVLILVAAAVLITPGVLTDLVGFLCLIPACRQLLKRYLKRRFERAVREGAVGVTVAFDGVGDPSRRPPMKNVTPRGPAAPGS